MAFLLIDDCCIGRAAPRNDDAVLSLVCLLLLINDCIGVAPRDDVAPLFFSLIIFSSPCFLFFVFVPKRRC